MTRWTWWVAGAIGIVVSSPAWLLRGDARENFIMAAALAILIVTGGLLFYDLRRSGK